MDICLCLSGKLITISGAETNIMGKHGAIIKEIRKKRKMSQEWLAIELGLSRGQLSKIESGVAPCTMERFTEISKILDFEVSIVLNENKL